MTFPWPWLCQWTLDVQAAIIHPSASPQTLTAEAQIEKLKSSIQLLGKAPGEGWLVMPPVIPISIDQLVEKLKSLRSWFRISRKIEAKWNLRRICSPFLLILFTFFASYLHWNSILLFSSASNTQQPGRGEPQRSHDRGDRDSSEGEEGKHRGHPGQRWSTKGAKVGHRFLKETCPLKIVVLFFWAKNWNKLVDMCFF